MNGINESGSGNSISIFIFIFVIIIIIAIWIGLFVFINSRIKSAVSKKVQESSENNNKDIVNSINNNQKLLNKLKKEIETNKESIKKHDSKSVHGTDTSTGNSTTDISGLSYETKYAVLQSLFSDNDDVIGTLLTSLLFDTGDDASTGKGGTATEDDAATGTGDDVTTTEDDAATGTEDDAAN